MTLLTTEIHRPDRADAVIVFAADRRISRGDIRDSEQPKIFRIDRLHAGIGYFGLAEVPAAGTREPMAAWLEGFLMGNVASTLGDLACELSATLNAVVPAPWRNSEISGFHLCGFATQLRPEFWYIRNCDDSPAQNPLGTYSVREDFQARDAPRLAANAAAMVYRNGDIRAHVCAWEAIDKAFIDLLTAPDFRVSGTPGEYERWVEYKMELIAQLYERFCTVSIIGRPVDVFSIVW
jgi:hypothetical protein